MKKLFIVLAVASLGFVACNNEAETKSGEDTTVTVTPSADTVTKTVTSDTTVKAAGDTTVKTTTTTDTTTKK